MSATHEALEALWPGGREESRADRAKSQPMRVRALGGGLYDVQTGPDRTYTVDLTEQWCTCPDFQYRHAKCKHLRRAAIEVTERHVPRPGERETTCGDCGELLFVDSGSRDPVYCADCTFEPGEFAIDTEQDALLVVSQTTDRTADETEIRGSSDTVASYPENREYQDSDVVVEAMYPVSAGKAPGELSPADRRVYSFPRGRLRHVG